MKIIVGALLIFCAAWLMVRLQAGSGSCCGASDHRSGPGSEHGHDCCVEVDSSSNINKAKPAAESGEVVSDRDMRGDR